MNPERFRRLAEVFEAAWREPAPQRGAFVEQACGGDEELRSRVVSLLVHFENSRDPLRSNWLENAAAADAGLQRDLAPLLGGGKDGSSIAGRGIADETRADRRVEAGGGAVESIGDAIDRYELIERLGEGGFGTVFRARQTAPVAREVALKVVKPGMDSRPIIARFSAERQALAVMDHPGIAKVFDAGQTADGRPYFVMELVRGSPITRHCNDKQLDLRQRIELFMQVCQAVQHAHQKGVIHRDIKPSNVLVVEQDGRPTPKVIDFGIAKATQQPLVEGTLLTLEGQFIGTPAYMSPEQADLRNADIDTRSDIYALGVLLYELLCGAPPFDVGKLATGGLEALLRTIREIEPVRPSVRNAGLPAELDWIVMKCLEKDRGRRYASAAALADDLQHHLRDEPVDAGPPSRGYRLKKLVRRNRAAFATGGAILALLVLGVIGTGFGLLQARQERDAARDARADEKKQREAAETARADEAAQRQVAQSRRAQAEAVTRFLTSDLLGADDPYRAPENRDERISDVVTRAEQRLASGALAGQPAVEAALHEVLGHMSYTLGRQDACELHARRALELHRATGADPEQIVTALSNLAEAVHSQGRLPEAAELYQETRRLADAIPELQPDKRAVLLSNHAELLVSQGDLPAAEEAYRAALAVPNADTTGFVGQRGVILSNLGDLLRAKGDLEGAIEAADQSLELLHAAYGEEHATIATVLNNKALALNMQRNTAAAEPIYRAALEMRRKVLPPTHVQVAQSMNNLASLLRDTERFAEAEPLYRETLAILQQALPPGHFQTALIRRNLGNCLIRLKRFEEAESEIQAAYDQIIGTAGLPPQHTRQTIEAFVKLYKWWLQDQPESAEVQGKLQEWESKLAPPASAPAPPP
ncbi:Serine/threonine-protein kinase PknB [Phycisphaerae bacterium RAS1]|nr:Serine/threonine-protein kinase PknB [Phycisphaerae bacterium RAS1]